MYFKSFFNKPLAQMSYLIGCQQTGEALLIDPLRDLDPYIYAAEAEQLTITKVTETHIHADFASGLRDVCRRLDAVPYVSAMGGEDWAYQGLPDSTVYLHSGDQIKVGKVELDILHTPGHTPESVSLLLTDRGGGSSIPMGIFTGDFLFVGDVGRPDLLEESAEMAGTANSGADDMYASLQRIKELPDHLQVWPGHGAGSACGKSLGAVPMTTLGYEKVNNWAFKLEEKEAFKEELLADQPEPPSYFSEMKVINKTAIPQAFDPRIHPLRGNELTDLIIDLRPKEVYQAGHIRGSINIPSDSSFSSYAGWFVDYGSELTLVGSKHEADEAARQLQQIGFDKVKGYLPEHLISEPVSSRTISSDDFLKLHAQQDLAILDVRNKTEWDEGHLQGARHKLFGKLLDESLPFDKNTSLFIHCESGVRSAIAIGALEKKGFSDVININGGYAALTA